MADVQTPDAASDALDLARLDGIMEKLDAGEPKPRAPDGKFVARETGSEAAGEPEPETEQAPVAEEDAAQPEEAATGEDEESDPEQETDPPLAMPRSWAQDRADRWTKFDRQTQQMLLEDANTASDVVRKSQNEAAETRKKAEAELQATAQERQRLAQTLQALSQYAQTMDPVIGEGMKTDWVKLSQEDPAAYVAKQAQFQQRMQVMQAVQAEQHRLAQQHYTESKAAHDRKLAELIPDFSDAGKAKVKKDSYVPLLASIGYSAQEIEQGWGQLRDPREYVVIDRLAKAEAELAALKAEKKSIPGKKVPPVAAPVVRPKAVVEGTGRETAQVAALRKQADKSKRLDDRVNLVMAKLRS